MTAEFPEDPDFPTTRTDLHVTDGFEPLAAQVHENELSDAYERMLIEQRLSWTSHLRFLRRLGVGGQGEVYLSERKGADGFSLPVAVKVFAPDRYATPAAYGEDMTRIARVSGRIARIQHENLLLIQNFLEKHRIRILAMEWIEGFDLRTLTRPRTLARLQGHVSPHRWKQLNEVVLTAGWVHSRFKPGMAVDIVRDCLAGLAALHREGIVHGDIKPANVMVRRSGAVKLIDYGSAIELSEPPRRRSCTPSYAAVEVLEGRPMSARSDLASLGYVLIELLSGRPLFADSDSLPTLIEAKRRLPDRLATIVPYEVACNELLMGFCQRLVAPDENLRFPTAEAADLLEQGAAAFHRQLIRSDLASEYGNELRLLVEDLLAIGA